MNAPESIEPAEERQGLTHVLVVLRRRWMLVAGVVLACLLISVVRHERSGKSYTATASVAFQSTTLPDAALQVSPSGSSEPQRAADTEVLIAHSSQVAEGVRRELKATTSANALLGVVKVEAAPNADVLNIIATSADPKYSARVANAFAAQYIAFKTAAQVSSIEAAERKLAEQLATLPAGSAARLSLEQSQQRLSGLRAVAGGGANIISLATPPSEPSGLGLTATALIGVFVGLALAFSIVFILESLDRRVKTIEEFEHAYRLPALSAVPQSAFSQVQAKQRRDLLEPYRILRSALDFAAVARKLDTVLITSAISGEGKTTVAVDLAQAVALTGRQVVLAELDLRRPTFARHLALPGNGGLTAAITSRNGVGPSLRQPFADLPNLSVLTAGRLPPNPSELLATDAISALLRELAVDGRFVIVDAPPLNPVSDAQVLLNSPAIDAVLMVARVDVTTREEVRRARMILDRHTVAPVGLVITGLRDSARYGYESYAALEPALDHQDGTLSRPRGGTANRQARR